MSDILATEGDASATGCARCLRSSLAATNTRATERKKGRGRRRARLTAAAPVLAAGLLVGVLAPATAQAEPAPPLPDGPLTVAPTPTPSLMPTPGTWPAAPAPAPAAAPTAPTVWELSAGAGTPVPVLGVPVPLGGEVGVLWGPGWTDFQLTSLGGIYGGARVSLEQRPARDPGTVGEGKISSQWGPFRGEFTYQTDLSQAGGSLKGSAGPFNLGRNFDLYPTPQLEGWRTGMTWPFTAWGYGTSGGIGCVAPRPG
jgi:hypothetical protein